jgi:uncharacterized protein
MEFDPFKNRLCRNIRNELSESLMEAIHSQNIGTSTLVAQKYESEGAEPFIDRYIRDRMTRYQIILDQVRSTQLQRHDAFMVALLLWDQELFFEVHEWLEIKWCNSQGAEKMIFQALIRAAGVYIHLEHGRIEGAKKMASKAVEGLTRYKALAPSCYNIDLLIEKLKALDPVPPKLGASPLPAESRHSTQNAKHQKQLPSDDNHKHADGAGKK